MKKFSRVIELNEIILEFCVFVMVVISLLGVQNRAALVKTGFLLIIGTGKNRFHGLGRNSSHATNTKKSYKVFLEFMIKS